MGSQELGMTEWLNHHHHTHVSSLPFPQTDKINKAQEAIITWLINNWLSTIQLLVEQFECFSYSVSFPALGIVNFVFLSPSHG